MVLDGKSFQEHPAKLEFFKALFLVLHLSYNMLMTFLILSVILTVNLWQHLELTLQTGVGRGLLISMLEKLYLLCLTDLITLLLLMGKWMCLFLKKNHLWRCWNFLFFLNWIETLTLAPAKIASKEMETFVCSMNFFSPEVAFYIYNSTTRPCIEYCSHVWTGVPSCHLDYVMPATEIVMKDYWSLTCCLSWTLDWSSKCSQFKPFL